MYLTTNGFIVILVIFINLNEFSLVESVDDIEGRLFSIIDPRNIMSKNRKTTIVYVELTEEPPTIVYKRKPTRRKKKLKKKHKVTNRNDCEELNPDEKTSTIDLDKTDGRQRFICKRKHQRKKKMKKRKLKKRKKLLKGIKDNSDVESKTDSEQYKKKFRKIKRLQRVEGNVSSMPLFSLYSNVRKANEDQNTPKVKATTEIADKRNPVDIIVHIKMKE